MITLEQAEAEIGRRSLHEFVRMAWHVVEPATEFKDNYHVAEICSLLEKVSRGELRHLIVNIPPGSMKSLLVCVFWNAWSWVQNPGKKFLYTSFDAKLTRRDGERTFKLVSSPWFQARWGRSVRVPSDAGFADYSTTAGGQRYATSVRGKTTGNHPHVVVVDDPIKPKDLTQTALLDVQDWWRGTMSSRGDQSTVARVIIMQRLHDDDLCGWLEREQRDIWTVYRVPVQDEQGNSFWPERFSRENIQRLKRLLGPSHFAAQYMQNPVPPGGLIFKESWLQNRYVHAPSNGQLVLSVDATFKGTNESDFVVIQAWLRSGSRFYLLDQSRGRWTFTETQAAILKMRSNWPRTSAVLVEDKANGSAILDTLKKHVPGMIPVNPEGGKEARAQAVTGLFEAGDVFLPERSSWVDDYVTELARFPKSPNDDQVDCTTQALVYLNSKSVSYEGFKKLAASTFVL